MFDDVAPVAELFSDLRYRCQYNLCVEGLVAASVALCVPLSVDILVRSDIDNLDLCCDLRLVTRVDSRRWGDCRSFYLIIVVNRSGGGRVFDWSGR